MEHRNVDGKIRKPRQARGTPAFKFSGGVAIGVVSVAVIIGLFMHNSSYAANWEKQMHTGYLRPNPKDEEFARSMSFVGQKTSAQLKEEKEYLENLGAPKDM